MFQFPSIKLPQLLRMIMQKVEREPAKLMVARNKFNSGQMAKDGARVAVLLISRLSRLLSARFLGL